MAMRLSKLQLSGENQLQQMKSDSGDMSTVPGNSGGLNSSGGTVLYRFGQEVPATGSRGLRSLSGGLHSSSSMPSLDYYDPRPSDEDNQTVGSHLTSGNMTSISRQQQHPPRSMKLVSGSQFRLTSHAKGMIPPHCEQCDTYEKLNKKNKEIIRTLKVQIMRMEENFRDLKYSKGGGSSSSSLNVNGSDQPEAKENQQSDGMSSGVKESNLRRKCEYFEDELNKYKKMLSYERSLNEQLKQTLDDERGQYKTLNENLQQENEKLRQYIIHLETTNTHYKTTNDDLQAKLLSYKQQLEKTEQKLNESLEKLTAIDQNMVKQHEQRTNAEIEKLRKEVEKLEANNKGMQFTIGAKNSTISQQEDQISELNARIAELEAMITGLNNEVKTITDTNKTSQEQLTAAKKRCDVLESTVKATIQERDLAKGLLFDRDTEVSSKARKIEVLESDIVDLNNKLNGVLGKIGAEADTHKRALEKAITSSVRLCVVAPTVNVQVNDVKHKFKSKISEKALKQFLDTEIFDRYCFLFKQGAENAGPTGGSLEAWLQRMLAQMQSSIESHVNNAMEGSSV